MRALPGTADRDSKVRAEPDRPPRDAAPGRHPGFDPGGHRPAEMSNGLLDPAELVARLEALEASGATPL
ncbi:hypothetical protein ABZ260_39060, partial [Streptosporangium sp. NPDC006013]|uniref:hypothetical protein n=1 Tax=Streptosporangium sp. NPDC006013 TaxID=3155596 RepID=UPI0033A0867A